MTGASRYDVVVVGAGHNGLTAAALLAKAGRRVLVVERRDVVGGLAAGEAFHPGYRTAGLLHDTSCVRPGVVEALALERHGLELLAGPPSVLSPSQEGPGLLLHHNADAATEEIAAHTPRDVDRYRAYRRFMARVGRVAAALLDAPPEDLGDLGTGELLRLATTGLSLRRLGRADLLELLRVCPMCVADYVNEWFESDALRCLLASRAISGTWSGPWSPGTNALLLRWEALAGRHAKGGAAAVVAALRRAAEQHGAEIRTSAPVTEIRVASGRVSGVTLEGGEVLDAGVVAASCDPKTTLLSLLPRGGLSPKAERRVATFRTRGTTAAVSLALSRPPAFSGRGPDVAFAHTGRSLDDMERAFDAVKYGRASETPLLDVHVPTVTTPDLAPAGHAVVTILVHFAPFASREGWTDAARDALGDRVVNALAGFVPGLVESIVAREVLTPDDLRLRYGLTEGHVHHGEHALDQLLVRPSPECARYATPVEGLYLCGSGSHPGGGVTCAPGTLAAGIILRH